MLNIFCDHPSKYSFQKGSNIGEIEEALNLRLKPNLRELRIISHNTEQISRCCFTLYFICRF